MNVVEGLNQNEIIENTLISQELADTMCESFDISESQTNQICNIFDEYVYPDINKLEVS